MGRPRIRPLRQYRTEPAVPMDTPCELWPGRLGADGYGYLYQRTAGVPGARRLLAHRVAYEDAYGPIPAGLTVDHLCFVPSCINPDHLRLLTRSENSANHLSARKTQCVNGHDYTPENTYRNPSAPRHRRCRACLRTGARRYLAKRRARLGASAVALMIAAAVSLVIAPSASASAGYWAAGTIYSDNNGGGQSSGVQFHNVGACNSSGYTLNLRGTSLWSTKISSFSMTNYNGCNRARVHCGNGQFYFYSTAGLHNLTAACNDNADTINYYRA